MKETTLIERWISWLQAHRPANVLLVTAYFLLVVLPHEAVGSFIHRMLFKGSVPGYNLTFMVIVGAGLLLLLIPFVKTIVRRPPRRTLLWGLGFVIVGMVVAYVTIMVLATETIHFGQYAVLALLLYPLLRNVMETLTLATCLGIVDEAYQYFWLIPDNPGYFDFNDVILNCIGAGLGLIILRICDQPGREEVNRPLKASPVWLGVLLSFVGLSVMYLTGWWRFFPAEGSTTQVVLMPAYPETFWSMFYEKQFHVVHPAEAVVVLAMLFFILWRVLRLGSR